MYLVRAIKFFIDSQAPTVEESFRNPGVEFEVTKERLDLLLSMFLVEVVKKPVEPQKVEEEIIKPKEKETMATKSNNGGRKNGRKQSVNVARKNR